ncbi:ABC transporter permease [Clostridium butyricum]|uniref:ABC transporter permease n=1 Tax=Clostridium butyricum TaxID=1492 RepID=UPI002ABDAEFD|nr:FtsX-like permease family protein [Clostridium butyricum]
MINNYTESYTQVMENRDIAIVSNTYDSLFSVDSLNLKGVKDVIPQLEFKGWYKKDLDNSTVTILGRKKGDIQFNNAGEENALVNFTGAKCIISKRVSTELNIKENDIINIVINNEKIPFTVQDIYLNEGIFFGDTDEAFNVIVPYEYLSSKFNIDSKYNKIISGKTASTVEQSINEFNDVNTQVKAETSFANHEGMLNAIKEGRTICFALLTIVILLSAVIISSSFKLIIVERMPVIGTFFSQGATKKNIIFVLLTESSLFGILGGVLAFLIGVGAIYAASYFLSQHKDYGVVANPQIPAYYFALTVIFGVLLSVLSSILPIIQIRKLSVKDVILGASNTNMRIGSKKLLAGLMFIILGIIVRFINIDGMISLSSILLILGIAFAFPKLIDIVVTFIYQYLKDKTPIVALALNNIRTSKELLNNITLILIASLSVISINSVGDGVKAAMTDGFNRNNFQIQITIPSNTVNIADTIISQKLNSSEIVQSSLQKLKVFTGQQDGVAFQIAGVDSKKYLSYDGYVDWDVSDNKRIYNEFKDSKEPKIIISKSLAKAIKVQEGEKLKLNINNIEKDIEIAGTVDMKMLYGGYVVLIDNEVLEKEFNYIGTNNIVLQTIGEEDTVRNQLRNLLQDYNVKVITFKELERANLAENEKTIAGFGVFSLIAVIVASFGVLNNTRISYLNSKRNIALLHAIGLNRIQKNKLLIYQSIFVMFWVIILLIPCSWAMVTMTKDLLGLLGLLYDIKLNIIYIPIISVVLFILIILATIPVILNGKKFSIINEMKYE